jgi:hypothetical protein
MLRNLVLAAVTLTGLVLLAGCIKSKTVVTVQKDGSGTVEETVYFKELGFPMAGAKSPSPAEQLPLARAQAAQTAKSMGEGVTVQTVEQVAPRDGWKGMRIVYGFRDVSKIGVPTMPQVGLGGVQAQQGKGEEVRFEFTAEPTPKLTIVNPPMTPPAEAGQPMAGQDEQSQAMAKAMMAQFLDGMMMEFQVKVGGKITQTNATYVSASREVVGLARMDLGALAKDPEALNKMMSMGQATARDEVEKQLQDPRLARHVKVETKEQVEVTFE